MSEEVMEFHLTCKCGYTMDGIFYPEDEDETLHCECGLVWTVARPREDQNEHSELRKI